MSAPESKGVFETIAFEMLDVFIGRIIYRFIASVFTSSIPSRDNMRDASDNRQFPLRNFGDDLRYERCSKKIGHFEDQQFTETRMSW